MLLGLSGPLSPGTFGGCAGSGFDSQRRHMILKRLTLPSTGDRCCTPTTCPAVMVQIDSGELPIAVVIGEDVTQSYMQHLPPGTAVAENERIVRLPLHVIIEALTTVSMMLHPFTGTDSSDGTHTDNP